MQARLGEEEGELRACLDTAFAWQAPYIYLDCV